MPRVDLKSERACDYKLRISTGLRSKVERSARKAKRSANKEMVARLESTFDDSDTKKQLATLLAKVTAIASVAEMNAALIRRLEASQNRTVAIINAVQALLTALSGLSPDIVNSAKVQTALEQLGEAMSMRVEAAPAPKQPEPAPALTE
jgi:hypothetical protein